MASTCVESLNAHGHILSAACGEGRAARGVIWRYQWLALAIVLIGPGCATIREGAKQTIAIDTQEATGADCAISTAKGKPLATVVTPGEIRLRSRKSALTIFCRRDGFQDARQTVTSAFNKRSRFQGPEGMLVDAVSGAMWRFPSTISILMHPLSSSADATVTPETKK
jgi:hypothetical protein